MQSRNIILTGKQQVELRSEEAPALPPDGLLARTLVSLISTGTESICYRGELEEGSHWANWVKYPFYLGYSNVAVVEETGAQVQDFSVGDRIFTMSNHREVIAVKPPVVRIPTVISDEEAAWSKLATIAQTAVRRAELTMGASVAVIGLGPLGQLILQYARVTGAEKLLAIDTVQRRLDIAGTHGATAAFAGSAADALPFVQEHTDGRLADVVFEATGHYAVFPLALRLVRRFGTVLLAGDSPYPGRQVLTPDVITRQVSIRGTHNENLPPDQAMWTQARQAQLFYTYVARGQMRVDDLITSRFSPTEAPTVYAMLLENRAETLGVLFDWRRL